MPKPLKLRKPFDIPLTATGSWTVVVCGQRINLYLQRMRIRGTDGRFRMQRFITHAILKPTDSPATWQVWSHDA